MVNSDPINSSAAWPKIFDVARLTKRIMLSSLMVMIASDAVSAMTRELSTISSNEEVELGAFVDCLVANLMPPLIPLIRRSYGAIVV
jgi:hypothetical protein